MKNIWLKIIDAWLFVLLIFATWLDSRNDTAPPELKEGLYAAQTWTRTGAPRKE